MCTQRKAEEYEDEKSGKKAKKELSLEEKAEKELRTVFVGNLPVECIDKVRERKKSMIFVIKKKLKRLCIILGWLQAIRS